ncbi:MAG TPA: COX15/CtaA family protein [Hyphomicrobiaceae bacterium]|nr:COX15/CtaA family protein [Hyphomicrobiaceae bacterium]
MAHSETLAARPAAHGGTGAVRVWLLTVAALVFLIVTVGGATRLTGSGLSITEWQPIVGIVPPLNEAQWQEAFAKYRQIPQYQHVNRGMSLEAFKGIFWWEWAHRFLGRFIGVVFFVPFVWLFATGQIPRGLLGRLGGIFALGALQGAAGWYMVASGLAERISVSQYRLALHLSLAILIFGALIWVALSLDDPPRRRRGAAPAHATAAMAVLLLVFVQIVLGAFVAGLKAGHGYNTWPLMDGRLIPGGLGVMEPWYLNLFENALTVQFNHRVVAYLLLAATLAHVWVIMRGAADSHIRLTALVLAARMLAQAVLGIVTLLAQVPLGLGLAHQAGAAAVFGLAVWHLHAVRHPRVGEAAV